MERDDERRREQRLRYHWPVWFAEDFAGMLGQGQMVDVSSGGIAFTCHNDQQCPYHGQHITARFSVPRIDKESFNMANCTRGGRVCRVDEFNPFLKRIAIQFAEPLPFKPTADTADEVETQERLKAVVI